MNLTISTGEDVIRRDRIHVVSPDISALSWGPEVLDAWDDEYGGVVIDPWSLPSSANAFASALKTSLSDWKLKVRMEQQKLSCLIFDSPA